MTKRLLLPVPIAVLAALALAACGGGEGDEDAVIDVIKTSATSTDPADCEALSTLAFMEQTTGSNGDEAVEECESDAEDESGDPDEVEVAEVEIEGTDASADVTFVGGNFDNQALTVGLVEADGDWKLDEIVGFASFDRESMVASFDESLAEAGDVSDQQRECIVEGMEGLSDSELEGLVIRSDQSTVAGIIEECVAA